MTTRALVLAGGGLAGIAWELGVLLGLADGGVDVAATADLVIGTSAGSAVAAQITSGEALVDSYARQLAPTDTEIAADIDLPALQAMLADAAATAGSGRELLRRIGEVALAADTVSEPVRRAVIAARVPADRWPARRLLIPAVDVGGEFVVFSADSGVGLVDAVAASCAVPGVWPPVTIDGHRYMDGGVRSVTNADLARGAEVALVLTPTPTGTPDTVAEELQTAQVGADLVLHADEAAVAAAGTNPLDPATRGPSARAGRALGRAEAARVRLLWDR